MGSPRLGAASLNIEWSDAVGLIVRHGTTGQILREIKPDYLQLNDWQTIWDAINKIEIAAFRRSPEGAELNAMMGDD